MLDTLPIHPRTGLTAIAVSPTGLPLWPCLGGAPDEGEQGGQGGGQAGGDAGQQQGQDGQQQGDPGYPANTAVADMSVEQQAAYWKAQARKHEGRATARQDYDAIRAERDQLRATHMTESEKALEQARQEGRVAVTTEVNNGAVTAIVDASLRMRGFDDVRVTNALKYLNPAAFVADGSIDTTAIGGYVDSIAGPVTGRTGPDFGAGNRGSSSRVTGAAAGLSEAEKRFGKKQ